MNWKVLVISNGSDVTYDGTKSESEFLLFIAILSLDLVSVKEGVGFPMAMHLIKTLPDLLAYMFEGVLISARLRNPTGSTGFAGGWICIVCCISIRFITEFEIGQADMSDKIPPYLWRAGSRRMTSKCFSVKVCIIVFKRIFLYSLSGKKENDEWANSWLPFRPCFFPTTSAKSIPKEKGVPVKFTNTWNCDSPRGLRPISLLGGT